MLETWYSGSLFAFSVDALNHLNDPNARLQDRDQLISDLYNHLGGDWEGRLEPLEKHYRNKEVDVEYSLL